MKKKIHYYSNVEQNRYGNVNYVSLTNVGTYHRQRAEISEKEIAFIFQAINHVKKTETEHFLFGCQSSGRVGQEIYKLLSHEVEFDPVFPKNRKGSFCIYTKEIENLQRIFPEIWRGANFATLFLIFGLSNMDSFIIGFQKLQHWLRQGKFFSFVADHANSYELSVSTYDMSMVDFFSNVHDIEGMETALFEAAQNNDIDLVREITD